MSKFSDSFKTYELRQKHDNRTVGGLQCLNETEWWFPDRDPIKLHAGDWMVFEPENLWSVWPPDLFEKHFDVITEQKSMRDAGEEE